jgi:hypothetical protein
VHGIFYVGKGLKRRTTRIDRVCNPHHSRIVAKYGKENIIVRKLACESEQHALDLEVQMISKLREIGVKLTNATGGGEGLSNPPNEVREKITAALLARPPMSAETKAKMSATRLSKFKNSDYKSVYYATTWKKGRVVSDETRAKISATNKLTLSSPEHKERMSRTAKNRTPEHLAKIGLAHKGKVLSDSQKELLAGYARNRSLETRAKLSAAATGKECLPETRAKMSASQKGKPKSPEHIESLKAAWVKRKAKLTEVSL